MVLVLALTTGSSASVFSAQERLELFSEEVAQELRVEGDDWDPIPRARSVSLGPVIAIRNPEITRVDGADTIQTNSPANMLVVFEPNQAPVDMSSLDVKAKKGLFSKSLTDKLTPYIDGTTLVVENLEVPPGKFQIEILVKDLEGNETTQTYRLVVENVTD